MKCPSCKNEILFPGAACPNCGGRKAAVRFWGFSRREILFYSIIGGVVTVTLFLFVAVCLWILSKPI